MISVGVALLTLAAVVTPVPAQAASSSPIGWAAACRAGSLGIAEDDVELAPRLRVHPDTSPDGTPVQIQPDRRGKYVPVIMVHGWTSESTHTDARDGTFSHLIDLTANRLGSASSTRSLVGQIQRVPGTAVFTFDYRAHAASWVDESHLGPALGKVIDCLFKASGEKVILIGHSMGGLIARYAANQRGVAGRSDRSDEISTVVTFGTPEAGSVAALLAASVADSAAAISASDGKTLAVLRLLLAECGRLSSKQIVTGTLCDKLPAPVRTFDSDAGIALRYGSRQLAALKPFPHGVKVDALAGDASFDLPLGTGWFSLPWSTVRVSTGDLIVSARSALDRTATAGTNLTRTVQCAYQLNAARGASDNVELAIGIKSKVEVPQQPLASFAGPCFHTHLMRSIELTNEATGAISDDVNARQSSDADEVDWWRNQTIPTGWETGATVTFRDGDAVDCSDKATACQYSLPDVSVQQGSAGPVATTVLFLHDGDGWPLGQTILVMAAGSDGITLMAASDTNVMIPENRALCDVRVTSRVNGDVEQTFNGCSDSAGNGSQVWHRRGVLLSLQ